MTATNGAEQALDKSVNTVQSLADWFVDNREQLPIGLAIAAAIVAVMFGMRWIGHWMITGDPDCRRWRGIIGRVLSKTTLYFMIATALDVVATYADVPARISRLTDILFTVAFALQGAIWARELVLGAIGRRVDDDGENALSNAMSIIRVLVSVAVFAIAVVVILDNLGVNVTALVAGLGIGGIAIGLAAQGIFSDLFAALAILFDRPFRRGDTIRYDQTTGTVERIGLKTTRLRSATGEQVIMANTKLLEREIHNLAEGHSRLTTLNFGLVFRSDPEKLREVPELARAAVKSRSGCTFDRCAITKLGASSIDFELLYNTATVDADAVAADRTAIVIALLRSFAQNGLEFAYPTQTTYTAAPDGTLVMPYAEHPAQTGA